MNEPFYQMYKAIRNVIEEFTKQELDIHEKEYAILSLYSCLRLDRKEPQYYERWKKERNEQ